MTQNHGKIVVPLRPDEKQDFFVLSRAFSPVAQMKLWYAFNVQVRIAPNGALDSLHLDHVKSLTNIKDQGAGIYIPAEKSWVAENPETEQRLNSLPVTKKLADFLENAAKQGSVSVHAAMTDPESGWRRGALGISIPATFEEIGYVLVHKPSLTSEHP